MTLCIVKKTVLFMGALFDLFDTQKLRERMGQPWKTIAFPTKIALYFSLGLVALGALAFALEKAL